MGSPIGIFALSSPFDPGRFRSGLEVLRGLGFDPVLDARIFERRGYLAGLDVDRVGVFHELCRRDDVSTLMAARGGYGVHRVLDALAWDRLAERTIVGFSDLTALQLALWTHTGASSIHGPVVTQLAELPPEDHAGLADLLRHPERPVSLTGVGRSGSTPVEGTLWGGCLALVAGLLGTRHFRWPDPTLLLLEEVAEAPYRVDRMLTQLELAGARDRVAGVALGAFTDCEARADDQPDGLEVALERLSRWGVPILSDLPIGHGARNRAVPVGRWARIDPASGTLVAGRS